MKTKQIASILIVANGEPPGDSMLSSLKEKSDCIIAADGGANLCHQKSINPDYIIGDLDSVRPDVLSYFSAAEVIQLADQETHDLKKAIDLAITLNPKIIRIIAAFGKRLDHSLANLLLLQSEFTDIPLEFYDDFGMISTISGEQKLDLPVGRIVSLFSFLPVYGVTLTGFKYPIQNKDYTQGFNGLSNIITSETAKISIVRGFLLLYIANEDITT